MFSQEQPVEGNEMKSKPMAETWGAPATPWSVWYRTIWPLGGSEGDYHSNYATWEATQPVTLQCRRNLLLEIS